VRFEIPESASGLSGIYAIVNLTNGKLYVGSAVHFARRFRQHLHDLRHGKHRNQVLQASFEKHGESSFAFTLLELVQSKEQLVQVEQGYLDQFFDGKNNCYNISPTASSTLGVERTLETIRRHRESLAAHYSTHSGPRLGVKLSEVTKHRLSQSHIGLVNHTSLHTEETRRKISDAKKGQRIYRRRYDVTFIGPDGVVYEHVTDVKNFAKEHELNADGLYRLVNGKYGEYHGWRVSNPT
jgi:group I intron endonuclease